MADKQTTESPWDAPIIIGQQRNATLFGFDQGKTREPTLIIGPARMGMSYLMRMNDAKTDDGYE
ncbi:hypothetical protein HLH44_19925 [Gluconacetobacter sp. 1c LMG 22058]|uniref:Uncharacterized protein n=1 Tax=Gluconacetobacter dulcium TaxID=2729096 RepID=A0A7W4K3J5_9PROT|nr:hypothetical protein [Gluconacetobacter dulcium]MBB2199668.1 hypothetical protein [Gluconacetobacter dulcium]